MYTGMNSLALELNVEGKGIFLNHLGNGWCSPVFTNACVGVLDPWDSSQLLQSGIFPNWQRSNLRCNIFMDEVIQSNILPPFSTKRCTWHILFSGPAPTSYLQMIKICKLIDTLLRYPGTNNGKHRLANISQQLATFSSTAFDRPLCLCVHYYYYSNTAVICWVRLKRCKSLKDTEYSWTTAGSAPPIDMMAFAKRAGGESLCPSKYAIASALMGGISSMRIKNVSFIYICMTQSSDLKLAEALDKPAQNLDMYRMYGRDCKKLLQNVLFCLNLRVNIYCTHFTLSLQRRYEWGIVRHRQTIGHLRMYASPLEQIQSR